MTQRQPIRLLLMIVHLAAAVLAGLGLGGVTASVLGVGSLLPAALIFTVVSAVLVAVDLRTRRLPHVLVLPAIVASLSVQAIASAATGNARLIVGALVGGLVAGGAMLAVHLVSPEGLGFGDVTYSALIGVTLGSLGLARVGLGLGLGFMIGALIAGPAMVMRRRLAGPEGGPATIPFGPALAAGAWVTLCWGETLTRWYLG